VTMDDVQYALEDDFTPDQIERSRRRKRELRPLRIASAAIDLAAVCVLGFTPLGAHLVHAAGRLAGGGWAATAALGAVALDLVLTVLGLPLAARFETVNRAWGLSNRDWRLFWLDAVKGFLIGAIMLAGVSSAFYGLLRALPGTWWIAAAAAAAAFVFLVSFLVPVVIEPLFNRFSPMEAGALRDRLLALAGTTGVPVRDILVSDASRRTNSMNAYVSGIGGTRRIVVWDTTLDQAAPEEITAIAAHELGHAARRDVVSGTAVGAAGTAVLVLLLAAALRWAGLLSNSGIDPATAAGSGSWRAAADPRSLPLIFALTTLLGGLVAPLYNAYSRRIEARADGFALDVTRDPAAMVSTWRTLAVRGVSDLRPNRLELALAGTHPPVPARIAHARAWAAEHAVPLAAVAPPPTEFDENTAPEETPPHEGAVPAASAADESTPGGKGAE
jgi:Zn-dependent protease with chaperone function